MGPPVEFGSWAGAGGAARGEARFAPRAAPKGCPARGAPKVFRGVHTRCSGVLWGAQGGCGRIEPSAPLDARAGAGGFAAQWGAESPTRGQWRGPLGAGAPCHKAGGPRTEAARPSVAHARQRARAGSAAGSAAGRQPRAAEDGLEAQMLSPWQDSLRRGAEPHQSTRKPHRGAHDHWAGSGRALWGHKSRGRCAGGRGLVDNPQGVPLQAHGRQGLTPRAPQAKPLGRSGKLGRAAAGRSRISRVLDWPI